MSRLASLLERLDRPGALFHLDPPYYRTDSDCDAAFLREDHEALATALESLKDRIILMSDCEETRAIYGRFRSRALSCHTQRAARIRRSLCTKSS